jgi:hypothetical protein
MLCALSLPWGAMEIELGNNPFRPMHRHGADAFTAWSKWHARGYMYPAFPSHGSVSDPYALSVAWTNWTTETP